MGSRCDQCEENYFYNRSWPGCQECPACYRLVKDKVSWWQQCGHSFICSADVERPLPVPQALEKSWWAREPQSLFSQMRVEVPVREPGGDIRTVI